jgi:hypothetical protein
MVLSLGKTVTDAASVALLGVSSCETMASSLGVKALGTGNYIPSQEQ